MRLANAVADKKYDSSASLGMTGGRGCLVKDWLLVEELRFLGLGRNDKAGGIVFC